ncbi:ubiquitin thioesterase otulin-like [Hypanus sabinus]|uniref:ubiquitin thioesterase otulin-like n=1 Tax=Hypanus sabinus TaxID=79690 RepID=UPI0028C46754|nr:ubiquitin thioesterase otulin-like [Hypanus sabinus]XP_059801151.1 ubiquitin thioesterase otulin-like [Hypanus sabinus]XP_059801152.1 ubiquitin thioesterase otulin-like [Hypanus sabinus]XP_059801153.1 ubiquitin thioesterase otulin-like [Hypanus sabinus]
MGNKCCQASFQKERNPIAETEQEALLYSSKTSSCRTSDDKEHMIPPPKSVGNKDLTDPKNRADCAEICKTDAVPAKSVQQAGVESDFRELASKVQDTNLKSELKPVPVLNDVMSMEDQKTGLNAEKSTRCDVSEKPEQEIKVKQKTVQTYESNQLLDSVSQECKRDQLADFLERKNLYNLEGPEGQTKRVRLSQCESDHQDDLDQTQATLPGDEGRAKTLESKQLDCLTEGKSEGLVSLSQEEPGSSEQRGNIFNNGSHMSCSQEGNDEDEDLYRDEDEIEKDKSQKLLDKNQFAVVAAERSTIEPNMDILEYCAREWKGNTAKAELMRKAYEAVRGNFKSIRRVRGDNYCALRATLFQALNNVDHLPCLQQDDLEQIPDQLVEASYVWIKQWHFVIEDSGNENPVNVLKGYLTTLKEKYMHLCEMNSWEERVAACEELFRSETEEYRMYEAVKIMMLAKAIELDCSKVQEKEVPLFCWLMFARDTSTAPYQFMRNHLNHVGHTGGLDQVEMFLLGYSLQLTIRVFRLYKFGTDEFITYYPDDHKDEWPLVTLITEDDRHYNVPVKDTETTIL